jgi:hypothetical protein
MSMKVKEIELLRAEKFSKQGTNYTQPKDGYRSVVLLQSGNDIALLSVEICSPAEPAKDADCTQSA